MNETFQLVEKEVIDLDQFFQDWFNGLIDNNNFTRVENSMATDFEIISPSGKLSSRDEILSIIKKSHNSTSNIKIWVEDVTTKLLSKDTILCTYYELQIRDDVQTKRFSSAIFKPSNIAINQVAWIHVHETWVG